MEISAVNNRFNVATKSQYDSYATPEMAQMTSYPAYIEEETPKSGNMNLGMVALGVLGLAGVGFGLYKHKDVKSLSKTLTETKSKLEETATKLAEAEEKITINEKALDDANKIIEDLKKTPKKHNFFESIGNWIKSIGKTPTKV